MPPDVAELVGDVAENIENRSLLLDKFVFHKSWPQAQEHTQTGTRPKKWDEASRWSFIRISDGADQILNKEAGEKRRKAKGHRVEEENKISLNQEAAVAQALANIKWDTAELEKIRSKQKRRFVCLFRSAFGERASTIIATNEGRLAINLADSLIQNAGIALDRAFGLPYIPGSAIKGVCRAAALDEISQSSGDQTKELVSRFCSVFGYSKNDLKGDLKAQAHLFKELEDARKGAISFLPSYPINHAKIVVDLTNVHYPDYYKSGNQRDLSKERPRPNPFPTVESGAQFAFCLALNNMPIDEEPKELLNQARKWLEAALTDRGIGAKTAAGYGWFRLCPEILSELEEQEAEEKARLAKLKADKEAEDEAREAESARRSALSPVERAQEDLLKLGEEEFALLAKSIAEKSTPEQTAFVQLLRSNKEKKDRWKKWKKRKPELANTILNVAKNLKLDLQ